MMSQDSKALRALVHQQGVCEQIVTRGFCELPWPDISRVVEPIEEGFTRLIDMENERRRACFLFPETSYRRDELGEELEIGLLVKRLGEAKGVLTPLEAAEGRTRSDKNKHRFHYGDELSARLRASRLGAKVASDYRHFLSAARHFNRLAHKLVYAVAQDFDVKNDRAGDSCRGYPGLLARRVKGSETFTRLLRYEATKTSAPHANSHRDRCFLTVHWHSSHPGLVLFDREGNLVSGRETDRERILIFPGIKFWGATRGMYGSGTFHGVRSEPSVTGLTPHRFAVVSFVHCALDEADVSWIRAGLRDDPPNPALYKI